MTSSDTDRLISESERLVSQSGRLLFDSLTRSMTAGLDAMGSMRDRLTGCRCEIPPPCWYPRPAGDVHSHVCRESRATLRVRVTNCSPRPATITVEGAGAKLEVDHGMLNLGPMERGTAVVKLDFTDCEEIEELVWVRGCYDHYIRWTVSESRFGGDTCHELDVEDCPEYIHHWYDHFYCERPCPGSGQREHVAAG